MNPNPNIDWQRREADVSMVGPTITLKGELEAGEDLLFEGRMLGDIKLATGTLTIGRDGRVKGELKASRIVVDGHVEGTLVGTESVVLRATADVRGSILTPRISLEDGCKFKGNVDTSGSEKGAGLLRAAPQPGPQAVRADRPAGEQGSTSTAGTGSRSA